jgi:hypothetical protein
MVGVALALLFACDTSRSKPPSASVELRHRTPAEIADYLCPGLNPFHVSLSIDGPRLRLFGSRDIKTAVRIAEHLDVHDEVWRLIRDGEWTWKPDVALNTISQRLAALIELLEAIEKLDRIQEKQFPVRCTLR